MELGAFCVGIHQREQRADIAADVEHRRATTDEVVAVVVVMMPGHHATDSGCTSEPLTG